MEADRYPSDAPEKADLIDGALGEGLHFHDTHKYYAQGVGPQRQSASCVPTFDAGPGCSRSAASTCTLIEEPRVPAMSARVAQRNRLQSSRSPVVSAT